MVKFLLGFLVFSSLILHAEGKKEIRYFKEIGSTFSLPHHFEGLWPLLTLPPSEDHYRFEYQNLKLVGISFRDSLGNLKNGSDGWAKIELEYNEDGNLIEARFFDMIEKAVLSRSLMFSREVLSYTLDGKPTQTFYDAKGKVLKNREKHWKNRF